jgi:hypothetical protein
VTEEQRKQAIAWLELELTKIDPANVFTYVGSNGKPTTFTGSHYREFTKNMMAYHRGVIAGTETAGVTALDEYCTVFNRMYASPASFEEAP